MVAARASGTLIVSSLKQNAFSTVELRPGGPLLGAGGGRAYFRGGVPPPRGVPPHISIPNLPCDLWGGHPRQHRKQQRWGGVPHPMFHAQKEG